jgi:hypothetical protein
VIRKGPRITLSLSAKGIKAKFLEVRAASLDHMSRLVFHERGDKIAALYVFLDSLPS